MTGSYQPARHPRVTSRQQGAYLPGQPLPLVGQPSLLVQFEPVEHFSLPFDVQFAPSVHLLPPPFDVQPSPSEHLPPTVQYSPLVQPSETVQALPSVQSALAVQDPLPVQPL